MELAKEAIFFNLFEGICVREAMLGQTQRSWMDQILRILHPLTEVVYFGLYLGKKLVDFDA